MELNPAQMFADLWAMICLATITPHLLFYRNWPGIIAGLACAALAHYNPGSAIYWLLVCIVLSGVFFMRALTREFNGKGNSLGIVDFIDYLIERWNESREARRAAARPPVPSQRRYTRSR